METIVEIFLDGYIQDVSFSSLGCPFILEYFVLYYRCVQGRQASLDQRFGKNRGAVPGFQRALRTQMQGFTRRGGVWDWAEIVRPSGQMEDERRSPL